EPTDFIGAIKSKIEHSQGFTPSSQKIIFSGKVLADDKTLESYGFRRETDYLVLIVAKLTPTPTPMTPATPVAAHCSATATPTNGNASMPSPASVDAAVTSTQTSRAPFFPIGKALQSTISNMVNMGFEPDQVKRALRASYNNPDRAVEYLTTEIPAHLNAEGAAAVQVNPASAPATSTSDQSQNVFQQQQQQSGAGTDLGTPRASSSRDPQFQQFRQHLMQNPEPFLRFLAVQNPEMAQAFTANPEVLVQLLAAVGDSEGEEGPLPSAQVINLEALGFPRPAAIEAYLVCDKDEELAANYLLENGF
ncbi:hypothetical protein B0H13DRAFT_1668942, partial [Mycena leptocephala]